MSSENPDSSSNPSANTPPTGNSDPSGQYVPPVGGNPASSLTSTLQQLFEQYVRVLSHPSASTFAGELPRASWDNILTQLLLVSVVDAAIMFIDKLLNIQTILGQILLIQNLFLPIILAFNLIAFFVWTGLNHAIAGKFKGVASYMHYCYGYALILVPVSIASGLLNFIPNVGQQLAYIPAIYSFVLQVFMLMGVHRLNGSRAAATVLLSSFALIATAVLLFILLMYANQMNFQFNI